MPAALGGVPAGPDLANIVTYEHGSGNQQTVGTGTQQQTQGTTQANQYNSGQLQLQGQIPGDLNKFMTGNYSTNFVGLPKATWTAAEQNWQRNVEPVLAAQNGPGSPALGASYNDLLTQLAGIAGTKASANYLSGLGLMEQYATTPVGQNQNVNLSKADQSKSNTQYSRNQTNVDAGGLLGSVLNFGLGVVNPGGPFQP